MMRVMLADDEPIVRKALQTLPDWDGLECEIVYTACNGSEVLKCLEEVKPDILVTDIKMPGADGIEVAKYIWENKLPVKVIILTAYADFSYAQSAVKYNVIEYITKTGVLDGLEAAVRKCSEQIKEERKSETNISESAVVENFFRSVFDGSLYEEEKIKRKCDDFRLRLSDYRILLMFTKIHSDKDKKQGIYDKINGFLEEVFSDSIIRSLFIKRDMICLVLNEKKDFSEDKLYRQCLNITEMLESFLNTEACIGISARMKAPENLRAAYKQAEDTLGAYFLDVGKRVNFYEEETCERDILPALNDIWIGNICREIQKGNADAAKNLFLKFLAEQMEQNCTAAAIKNSGMSIQGRCRKLLAEYDGEAFYMEGHSGGVSKRIYDCMYLDEYKEVIMELIKNTTQVTGMARGKKNDIVADCEHYIEENYENIISVAQIAECIGTSISYLSRIFKESTGNTVIATINRKKLEKAKEYLERTDMKIYEIAEKLGFENVTYFSHFFKKQTGIAPKDWMRGK